MTVHGPYDTAEQARADIANPAGHADQSWRRTALTRACTASGVALGKQDRAFVSWLSDWEAEMVQSCAGIIYRAWEAGRDQLAGELADLRKRIDELEQSKPPRGKLVSAMPVDLDAILKRIEADEARHITVTAPDSEGAR